MAEARLNETWILEIDEVLIVRLPETRGALVGPTALLAALLLARFSSGPRSR